MLNVTQTGQNQPGEKIKPMAAHQIMDGSELFNPIQT